MGEAQFRTVEGMAASMVRMIRDVQPVGPYRIAGWSFGGTIAYEIASQLIGEDQRVEFLGLFDTKYEYRGSSLPEYTVDNKSWLFHSIRVELRLDESSESKIAELERRALSMDFSTLVKECQEASLLPDRLMGLTTEEVAQYWAREHTLFLANLQYIAQPIPIPIYLFAAQGEEHAHPLRRWDTVLPQNQIHVIPVPGTHQSMMQDQNIEVLGKALSFAIRKAKDESLSLMEHSYEPLVALRTGPRRYTPLFCAPGAGGNVFSFAELVDCLERESMIYGFEARGLDGLLVPHTTVPAAAKSYVQAINQIHPEGPVHLLGHSFGGWIVLEMAHRLRAAGRTIESLTIIDSEAPDNDDSHAREYNRAEALTNLIEVLEQIAGQPLKISQNDLDSRDDTAQRKLLHERLVRVGLISRRSNPDVLSGPVRTFGACLRTHYSPEKVYPDLVRLALMDDPKLDEETNLRNQERSIEAWRRWAPNLSVWRGPGNHFTILKAPHVQALAAWVRTNIHSNAMAGNNRARGRSDRNG